MPVPAELGVLAVVMTQYVTLGISAYTMPPVHFFCAP